MTADLEPSCPHAGAETKMHFCAPLGLSSSQTCVGFLSMWAFMLRPHQSRGDEEFGFSFTIASSSLLLNSSASASLMNYLSACISQISFPEVRKREIDFLIFMILF